MSGRTVWQMMDVIGATAVVAAVPVVFYLIAARLTRNCG